MLLRFFRKSFAIQYMMIALAGFVLWLPAWINPPVVPPPSGPSPLYEILFLLIGPYPVPASILGFIIVLVSAYGLNFLFTTHELIPKNSSLTGFMFLLIMSGNPENMTLTPVNISILLLIYILYCLLHAYNRKDPVDLAFTSGFFISLAALFYLPAILLYGFLLTGFFVYRSLNWREWVASFIGLATPAIFEATYYFWFDTIIENVQRYRDFIVIKRPVLSLPGPLFYVVTGLLLIFIFAGIFRTLVHLPEKTVEIRKKSIVLFWLTIWMAASLPWANNCVTMHPSLAFAGIVPFMTNHLLGVKKSFYWELILWFLMICMIIQSVLMFW